MGIDRKIDKVEQFVRSYNAVLRVTEINGNIRIVGSFDDLDPEPERSELQSTIDKIRRDIDWNDELDIEYQSLEMDSRYGSVYLQLYL
jgi:hypothetical protein